MGDYHEGLEEGIKVGRAESANEITRLRAELATARREGMEEAAKRLEELHNNHKYNPKTGEGREHDTGYYRAISEGVAHILYAAKEGK